VEQIAHFAHSRKVGDERSWQELADHHKATAKLAVEFAIEELKELASAAALWHDVGKYQVAFQKYIGADPEASNEATHPSVPHSAAGAALALERFTADDLRGLLLALVIEAHHGALKAGRQIEEVVHRRGSPLLAAARANGLPQSVEHLTPAALSSASPLTVRMLFSALVDADLLDTEAWDREQPRKSEAEALPVLAQRLSTACESRMADSQTSALNRMRHEVYNACGDAAKFGAGTFTLTVPTGGGKTLSGMHFALQHAVTHGKKRVIVVAPYTSILEQTAKVYREVLGGHNVVEHHSNLGPEEDTDRNRQASENWDAPVIVTTSVQFLESLYAAHKRPCRKLHRIANSVVLLDEVQTFPVGLLEAIHRALKELTERFGTTVVHGTATQPLLFAGDDLSKRLKLTRREIISSPERHFDAVRDRFLLHRVGDFSQPLTVEDLATQVATHETVLVIVHSRREAQALAERLGQGCVHLSAQMCAEHRSAVLTDVRERLAKKLPCQLVGTQLIEAGVDIDFPVVYRALAGLETLAQAAGRCNREMKMAEPGKFFVFRLWQENAAGTWKPSEPPEGSLRESMHRALAHYFRDGDPDLFDPQLFPGYMRDVLRGLNTDAQQVMTPEHEWDFPTSAARFRMIEDISINVVAPYGSAPEAIEALRASGPTRQGFRALQRFTVGLRAAQFERLRKVLDSTHLGANRHRRCESGSFKHHKDLAVRRDARTKRIITFASLV